MSRTFFSHVFFWPVIITKFVSKTYGGIELGTVNRYFYYDYTSPPKECPELFFPLDIFYYGLFHGLYLSRESCGHSRMVLLREIFIFTIQTPLGNVQTFF